MPWRRSRSRRAFAPEGRRSRQPLKPRKIVSEVSIPGDWNTFQYRGLHTRSAPSYPPSSPQAASLPIPRNSPTLCPEPSKCAPQETSRVGNASPNQRVMSPARSCNLLTIPGLGDDTLAILLRYRRNSYHGSGVGPTVKSLHGRPRPFSAQRGLSEDEGAKPAPLAAFTPSPQLFSFRSMSVYAASPGAVAHQSISAIDVPRREA
jgi:hypothetical protein